MNNVIGSSLYILTTFDINTAALEMLVLNLHVIYTSYNLIHDKIHFI